VTEPGSTRAALAPAATAFDAAIAVRPVGPGRYGGEASPGWSAPNGPNGGYLAAIVLQALTAEVADAERAPRSLTLHYLRPPAAGALDVAVAVERTGRNVTSLTARLTQHGRLCVLALAAFSRDLPSALDYAAPPPELPAADELEVHPPPAGAPEISHRLQVRPAVGAAPFSGADEAVTGGWLRLAEPRPADAAAAALYCDAWLPAPYTRLTRLAPAPTLDLTIHFRARLPLDGADPAAPVLGVFRSGTSAQGFFEEDGELWSPGGVLLAQSRQLALLVPGASR
jgi:acyl-CoA thioesterase